jgi:hypothetical protein
MACGFSRQCLESLRLRPCALKCTHLPRIRWAEAANKLARQIRRPWLDSLFAIGRTALPALFKLYDVPANENNLGELLREILYAIAPLKASPSDRRFLASGRPPAVGLHFRHYLPTQQPDTAYFPTVTRSNAFSRFASRGVSLFSKPPRPIMRHRY